MKLVGSSLIDLLTQVAETGYGQGEMAHLLLKGGKEMSQRASITSALLVRDPKILNTLLLKHGGLYNIIEIIVTENENLSAEAACGLTALAKHLKIETPKYDAIYKKTVVIHGNESNVEMEENSDESMVTFVSGIKQDPDSNTEETKVRFNEKTLTEISDVFHRMFNSNFKESKNKEVVLSGQSLCGIKYFLDCINQHSNKKSLRKPIVNSKSNDSIAFSKQEIATFAITSALEAYDICQIYLLPDLAKDIFDMIIQMIDADNVLTIFNYSLKHHKQELTELSINYYLSSNIGASVKVKLFRQADNSDVYKEWNELILDTIVYTCQNMIL